MTRQEIQALANEAFEDAERIRERAGGLDRLDEGTGREFDRANHAASWLFERAKRA